MPSQPDPDKQAARSSAPPLYEMEVQDAFDPVKNLEATLKKGREGSVPSIYNALRRL